MPTPVLPVSALDVPERAFPDEVVVAWNDLIKKHYCGGRAVIVQRDIQMYIAKKMECTEETVLDQGYMDIEKFYNQSGWVVTFRSCDEDGYSQPFYTFKKAPLLSDLT